MRSMILYVGIVCISVSVIGLSYQSRESRQSYQPHETYESRQVDPCATFRPEKYNEVGKWGISCFTTDGKGHWIRQPLLVIGGTQYRFPTPDGYIEKLKDLKYNKQGWGDLDDSIQRLEKVVPEFRRSK
jgi:hypothetical protein